MSAKELVIAEAMKLSPEDRIEVMEVLRESVDVEVNPEYEAAWAAEIKRRVDGHRAGTRKSISSEEAHRIIRGAGDGPVRR